MRAYKQTESFETNIVQMEDAPIAYQLVLKRGGAILPKRNIEDARVVNDAKNRTGKIIKSKEEVGGCPTLKSSPAPTNSDHDCMPDFRETNKGLNPQNADDRNKVGEDGYTMLKKYFNSVK